MKAVSFSRLSYPGHAIARGNGRPNPVDLRASKVHSEYVDHAKYADETYAGVARGAATGPFRLRLAAFGTVRGVVLGYYGEGSRDLHGLIHRCGDKIGVVGHRYRARLLLQGLQLVGDGRAFHQRQKTSAYRERAYAARCHAYKTATGPFCSRPPGRWWSAAAPSAVT